MEVQERLSHEDALKYAAVAGADAKQLKATPIPTDVDLNQPVALHDGEFGGMVLPETKLSLETFEKATDKVAAVGQLWFVGIAPMAEGEVVAKEKLRLVTIEHKGDTRTVPQCAMGVHKNSAGSLELLIYGKAQEPILKVALKPVDKKQEVPIDMEAERESDSATITLRILGKYEAKFKVTQADL